LATFQRNFFLYNKQAITFGKDSGEGAYEETFLFFKKNPQAACPALVFGSSIVLFNQWSPT